MLQRLLSVLLKILCPTYETFALTDRLYFRIVGAELELMNFGAGGSELVQSMKLSVIDAEQVFKSMKRACDHSETVKIDVNNSNWTIDATIKPNQNNITIVINGSLGYVRAIAERADVIAAVDKFNTRFGLI